MSRVGGVAFYFVDLAGGGVYNRGISIPYFYPSGGRKASGRFFVRTHCRRSSPGKGRMRAAGDSCPPRRHVDALTPATNISRIIAGLSSQYLLHLLRVY